MDTAVDLLSQFTGTGGGTKHALVNFGVASIFFALLLAMALVAPDRAQDRTSRTMIWGFGIALSRELFMVLMRVFGAYEVFTPEQLHLVFPPLEHALSGVGLALIAGAWVARLTNDTERWLQFAKRSAQAVGAVYVATAVWWAPFSWANPGIRFGQTWADWAFRITASVFLAVAAVGIARARRSAIANTVLLALLLLFGNEFLKIIDMALGEQYESTFAVIRHSIYLAALPMLAYAFIKSEARQLATLLSDLEHRVAERTAELATAVDSLEVANGELFTLAVTDSLTNVGNRLNFDEQLERAWSDWPDHPLSVLVIDLDEFKAINDEHGHAGGDAALRRVAQIARTHVSVDGCTISRIGGDEFGLIMPATDSSVAAAVAESIRREVAESTDLPMTISVGAATLVPSQGASAHDLVGMADRALYRAKERGRDEIVVADVRIDERSAPRSVAPAI